MQAMRVPGTSLTQSVEMLQQRLEKAVIAQVPEVERMFARSGTAEIARPDPMPPNASDAYIMPGLRISGLTCTRSLDES